MKSKLFDHQEKGLEMLRDALRRGRKRVMLQAPTGSGKTVLAAGAIDAALAKGKTVCFTVPALELIDQTVMRLAENGIDRVGVIQAQHPKTNPLMPVQVASVQTLLNRERPEVDFWVIDEAHIWFQAYYEKLFAEIRQPIIGLSATPWTRGLGKWYEELVVPATMRELQEAINPATGVPFLVKETVLAPTHVDLGDVKTVGGDYHQGQLGEKMNKPDLVGDLVKTWIAHGQGRSTLMFGVDRAHAKATQEQFKAAGINASYVDGFSNRDSRRAVRETFERGDVKVVCSVGCLTTGVDWDVRAIILARPTKSEILFVQMIGRGMRPAEAKEDVLILDHTDTYQRLGFAADVHHGELHDGARTRLMPQQKMRLPIQCQGKMPDGEPCLRIKPAGEHMCSRCGFAPERQNRIIFADGELGALNTGRAAGLDERMVWYAQLLGIVRDKKYHPGWAAHKFKAKFGDWPPTHWRHSVKPRPASGEVWGYIRHLDIKRRHGQRKASAGW